MNKYLVKIAETQEPVGPGRAMVNMTARSMGEGAMGGSVGAYAGGVHGGYASIRNSLDSQKGQ